MCMCLPWWSVLTLWLILILSVVAQEECNECPQNMFQQCHEDLDEQFLCVYSRKKDGIMGCDKAFSLLTDHQNFQDSRLPLNISCNVSYVSQEPHLYFSWDTSRFPGKAQYSICYRLNDYELKRVEDVDEPKRVEDVEGSVYHTRIPKQTKKNISIHLQLNVSFPDIWYVQQQEWRMCYVEKPDPPEITNATILPNNTLYLQWNLPKCLETTPGCFYYELKINGEVRQLKGKKSYTEPNVDPTQMIKIQMRAKNTECCESLFWSDWTSVLEVGTPATLLTELHIGVIIAIALGLPMILLAILLLCKFQRVFDKLFPPIPGPSIKIKGLLEKDITTQIMSHKCVEEVTEVEVKEDVPEEEEHW